MGAEYKICHCDIESWEDIVVDHDEHFGDRSTIYYHCDACGEDYAVEDFYTGKILYLNPMVIKKRTSGKKNENCKK